MKYVEKQHDHFLCKMSEYDSITDFNEYVSKAPINPIFASTMTSQDTSMNRWSGTESYEEAQQLLATGWTQAAERISKRLPVQTTQALTNRTKPTYNVVGGQASVPRFLQGIPTNMVDRKQVPMKQKIIVVNRDISFSSGVSSDQIFEEGVKTLQIVQQLEHRGYRVKMNVCWAVRYGSELLTIRVCIKKPEERFSIAKVAFPLAHTSMLRRIAFSWLERQQGIDRGFVHGYGYPSTIMLTQLLPKDEFFIPNFVPNVEEYLENMGLVTAP